MRTTRSKSKRQKVDEDAVGNSGIFRKIHSSGQVTEDDINQLYMILRPVCQGCRVNTKDNPNCFCGLIPPPNGSRKSGLWQKTSDILESLGIDPSSNRRASLESPAGLTNLGATCYANSILQCLYMNKLFREGIFFVEQDVLKKQPVLHQLARLFAQLHSSKMSFVDSAPFIRTLALDNSVQQDSHEFLTLLFSLLERCLSSSNVARARTVVQDLFRGGVSHATKCSECGSESAASLNIEDFYELELNVEGLKSLDESLDEYFGVEELQGENQYYCESCEARFNATRNIKLHSLPTVLNFQLKRYVFLPNTTTKKKITSPFEFPGELDMSHRLSEHSQKKWLYDLSAVLIHKGSAVNSGHYIARIKDENTEQWWEFDDEKVSRLGRHPFVVDSSSSISKQSVEPVVHSSSSETDALNGNHADTVELSPAVSKVQMFSSSEAYMLMYVLRRPRNDGEESQVGLGESSLEKDNGISPRGSFSLPSHLYEEVLQLNEAYSNSCEQYKSKKKSEMDQIVEKREEVRSVLSEAPVQSLQEPYFWISSDWLRHWADNIMSPKIDNTPIECLHGKFPVPKVGFSKRLSANAWALLFPKYGGGPVLAKDDCCRDCILEQARLLVCADSYRDRRVSMREVAEAALAGRCPDGNGKLYYVSKTWLLQWLRRKNVDSPCEADAEPTALIRCPHGELLPEKANAARRLLVPECLWLFIVESAKAVKPNDSSGCSVFPSDSQPCAKCSMQLTEEACKEDSMRDFKLKQRQCHEKLAQGKTVALSSYSRYYLIPSSWLSKWRTFSNTSGKNVSPPETLVSVLNSLKCEQHLRLLKRPPELTWRRGAILRKLPTSDELAIITENDWKLFCEDWGGIESGGISAVVEFNHQENAVGLSKDTAMPEQHMDSDVAYDGTESKHPIFKTCPEVCEDCIGERANCELMQKLSYYNEDICVCLVRGKEPPKSVLFASGNSLEPSRRTSKRSRKTNLPNSLNFKVSGSTSIYQLKMMIWEAFGVVKENQILHKGSKIIDVETATLSDMNIFAGDVLWVKDSEIHENRDIADELSEQKMEVQQTEEGFRGTLLTSNVSSEVISML